MEITSASRAHALVGQKVQLNNSGELFEFAEAHGKYKAALLLPHESDLPDFLKVRALVARLEAAALIERSQGARIELFEQADEQRLVMESIDQRTMWEDEFDNVVTTVGKNYALDGYLQTAVTIVGPYMGLVSLTSYSAVAAGDTMASHAGWLEAGSTNAPTYTSPRKTCAWSAASGGSKALSSALAFGMTGSGTVKGCFIVLSTGAVSTIDNTAGTLYSAGLFTGGDQPVVNGNTLNVSYTASL